MKLPGSALALVIIAAALSACVDAKTPAQLAAEDPSDPGHRTMKEFATKVESLEQGPRVALFVEEYKGKTLEITGSVDVKLTESIAFAIPPEQYVVWGTFTEADRARAFALKPGTYVRIRGTMVETIAGNSVSLDKATIVSVY